MVMVMVIMTQRGSSLGVTLDPVQLRHESSSTINQRQAHPLTIDNRHAEHTDNLSKNVSVTCTFPAGWSHPGHTTQTTCETRVVAVLALGYDPSYSAQSHDVHVHKHRHH